MRENSWTPCTTQKQTKDKNIPCVNCSCQTTQKDSRGDDEGHRRRLLRLSGRRRRGVGATGTGGGKGRLAIFIYVLSIEKSCMFLLLRMGQRESILVWEVPFSIFILHILVSSSDNAESSELESQESRHHERRGPRSRSSDGRGKSLRARRAGNLPGKNPTPPPDLQFLPFWEA